MQQDINVEQKAEKKFEEFESQTSHWGPIQTEPIQPKLSQRPLLEPLLGQTSNSILPHNRLLFSNLDIDVDEDNKMMQLVDMNDVLGLQFQESSPVSLHQHLY